MYTLSSSVITCMADVARKAGRLFARDFIEVEKFKNLSAAEKFVRAAEKRSDEIIRKDLKRFKPEYNILSEEHEFIKGENSNYTWIIDPLDGTTNFIHGIPCFVISIALRHKKIIHAGVIYDPIHDELYWAEKGKGAFLNNRRLRVQQKRSFKDCIACSYHTNKYFDYLCKQFPYIRSMGSISMALAYIASGRFDLYIDCNTRIWDIAAGVILIQEAGGIIDDLNKSKNVLESGDILAASPTIFEKIRQTLLTTEAKASLCKNT